MNVSPLSLATLAALALSTPVAGQERHATDLDEVLVTATRTATTVDATLAPVEVIDRAAIERSQARSLPDLLQGRAGVSISNQGGAAS